MAKTIKFNLICDKTPVRTIDDLQNHFSIEDVLAYYDNRLLHRWLDVRDYREEYEKVNAITADKPVDIAKELIRIFRVACDDKKIEEGVLALKYAQEKREQYAAYAKESAAAEKIIKDYHAGYQRLVDGILENPKDVALIKANIAEIVSRYTWLLKLNHRNLFYQLVDKSQLAIMCLLMNEEARKYYLPIRIKDEGGGEILDTAVNKDKDNMYKIICNIITTTAFEEVLGENLMTFSGVTDGYWKDLEPKGKRYMIIAMGSGDYVRPAGVNGGDLGYSDIVNEFVIVDGIDYKSNSSTRKLVYMEV